MQAFIYFCVATVFSDIPHILAALCNDHFQYLLGSVHYLCPGSGDLEEDGGSKNVTVVRAQQKYKGIKMEYRRLGGRFFFLSILPTFSPTPIQAINNEHLDE